MAWRPFVLGVLAMAAFGAGAAQAEVRIMMRSNPGSPASVAPPIPPPPPMPGPPPVSAPPAPAPVAAPAPAPAAMASAPASDLAPLRRGDADAAVSETAGDAPAPAPTRSAKRPADLRPAPSAEDSPSERRAASLVAAGAPSPVSNVRRRAQSPDEFRDRCTTDGGLMQGGGKYGLCIIR